VIAGDVRLSFRELDERSSRIAAALKRRGVERGMTVGLLMYTGTEYVESFFAACKIGALPFNLNYRYETDELRHLLADACASALILDSALEAKVRAALPDLPELKRLVIVHEDGKGAADDVVAYSALMIGCCSIPGVRLESRKASSGRIAISSLADWAAAA
jgi:fatty-acyl-CoA synthase